MCPVIVYNIFLINRELYNSEYNSKLNTDYKPYFFYLFILSVPLTYPTGVRVEDDSTITGTTATISFIEPDLDPDSVKGFFRGYRVGV